MRGLAGEGRGEPGVVAGGRTPAPSHARGPPRCVCCSRNPSPAHPSPSPPGNSRVGPVSALLPSGVVDVDAAFHCPCLGRTWARWLSLVEPVSLSVFLGVMLVPALPGIGEGAPIQETLAVCRVLEEMRGHCCWHICCPSRTLARQAQGSRGLPKVTGQVSWALRTLPRPHLSTFPSALCILAGWRAQGR